MKFYFPIDLLEDYHIENKFTNRDFAKNQAEVLSNNLKAFKVGAVIQNIRMTPLAILFDVFPDVGVSVKKIKDLRVDLEVQFGAPVEIVSIGDKQYSVKIAMKNLERPIVGLKSILKSDEFVKCSFEIPIAAGMDIVGSPFVFDLAEAPHMLVAGCSGSGKSVFINDLLLSVMYTKSPKEVRLILIDPKRVELGAYAGLPHLMMPVAFTSQEAFSVFNSVKAEMEKRYKLMSAARVKNIDAYNSKQNDRDKLPRIIIVVEEYMDMMEEAPKELENVVSSIARMARAAGIHLVLSTQRPSSDIISSSIKANLPCRASFTVVDWRESKIILDRTGAERLLGNGDLLYSATETDKPIHAQAAYVSYTELDSVIAYLKRKA